MFSFRQAQPSSEVDATTPSGTTTTTETPSHDVKTTGDSETAAADPPIDNNKPVVSLCSLCLFVFAPWTRSTHGEISGKRLVRSIQEGHPTIRYPWALIRHGRKEEKKESSQEKCKTLFLSLLDVLFWIGKKEKKWGQHTQTQASYKKKAMQRKAQKASQWIGDLLPLLSFVDGGWD